MKIKGKLKKSYFHSLLEVTKNHFLIIVGGRFWNSYLSYFPTIQYLTFYQMVQFYTCTGENVKKKFTRNWQDIFSRDCDVGKSDIDFNLDLDWWKSGNNSQILEHLMIGANYQKIDTFGKYLEIGYEEAWMKRVENGTKVRNY